MSLQTPVPARGEGLGKAETTAADSGRPFRSGLSLRAAVLPSFVFGRGSRFAEDASATTALTRDSYTYRRLPSRRLTLHHIPPTTLTDPHNGHSTSLQRPLPHHPGQDPARADVRISKTPLHNFPQIVSITLRNVHLWLTTSLQQHLSEPRRCCHHTGHQDTPDQGRQGRLQGHSSRWPGVQDPRAGCPQEQPGPTAG